MSGRRRASEGLSNGFLYESLDTLYTSLHRWRVDEGLFEARKTILPFVRGLRFSALLIYRVRKLLAGQDVTASWGVVLDESKSRPSRECDIIIHRNKWEHAWDGGDAVGDPVMDFRFVRRQDALAIISCKEAIRRIDVEMRGYVEAVREYVPRVWLFAECCEEGSQNALEEGAQEAGYESFWYLYSLDKQRTENVNEPGWFEFVKRLRSLAPHA